MGTAAPETPAAAAAAPESITTAAVVDAGRRRRSVPLIVLAVLVSLYALHWASAVVIPLLLGLMVSYALTPLAQRLVQIGLPRMVASALLVLGALGAIGGASYSLADDAGALIESLPEAAQKLRRALKSEHTRPAAEAIEKVQKAATELERAAEETGSASLPPARGVTKVQIQRNAFDVKDYLWPGTVGLITALGQAIVVVLIAFYLLASGDTFRRKMVRIAGPGFAEKKLTLQALDEVVVQMQRYLLVQLLTSALVGVTTGLVLWWIGVEWAAVWGVLAFILNFVPYFGNTLFTAAVTLMAFVQFGTFEMALLVGAATLVINSLEAYLLTPWLAGRAARMNPVAVFVGVLVWGWLLGVWGLFLGLPILMTIKAVCDRVEGLGAVAELLGE